MKNILLVVFCFIGLASPSVVQGQSFNVVTPSDTVYSTISIAGEPSNGIINVTGHNDTLSWHVDSTSFPADWLTGPVFGICDNAICRGNNLNVLWNAVTHSGNTYSAVYFSNVAHSDTGIFYLDMNFTGATTIGTYWMTITVTDPTAGTSRSLTFVISRVPSAVPVVPNISTDVVLYPNPASNELNIVYDASADIKNIAVYNIIGKVMTVYKVTSANSANLNLENMLSGIYFVRLANSYGQVVATKKFTKQ